MNAWSVRFARPLAAGAVAALSALPAQALFKVVNPDGTVTYTDRPPPPVANTRVTNLARPGSPTVTEPDLSLPAELRQPAQRHPVTLYTTSECSPCDAGRQLLVARGVGSQPLKGLSDVEWTAYLDAAGYPKQARLPRGWQARTTPMVERTAAPAATARVEPVPAPNAPQINETETVSTGTRLRF